MTSDDDDTPLAELRSRASSSTGQSSEWPTIPLPTDISSLQASHQNKGKAPCTESKGDHRVEGEPESYVDLNIFSNESRLENPKLARRLLKAVILLRD